MVKSYTHPSAGGKSFKAGSMGITAYIKPGWAVISPDPAERRFGVEMGVRLIP